MTQNSTVGWLRLISTLVLASGGAYLIFVLNSAAVLELLVWVEFISGSPGLSGVFIMVSVIVIFTIGCYVANWIASGFRHAE
jgi:hypothetical protein